MSSLPLIVITLPLTLNVWSTAPSAPAGPVAPTLPCGPVAPVGPTTLPASIVVLLLNVIIKLEPVTVAVSTPTPTLPCGPATVLSAPVGPTGPLMLPKFCTDVFEYVNKSSLDQSVMESLSELKGFIVDYPMLALHDEDISPSMAVRAICPNELWV